MIDCRFIFNTMKSKFFLVVFLLPLFSFSQNEAVLREFNQPYKGGVDLGVSLAFPQNNFAKAAGSQPYFGFGGKLVFAARDNSPISFGLSFNYFWMFRKTEKQTLRSTTFPFSRYEVETTVHGAMMPTHLHFRIMPFIATNSPVQPYIEGLAGFRIFNTRSKIEVDDLTGGEQPQPEIDNNLNMTSSYGYSIGVNVRVAHAIYVNARFENIYGGWGKYIDPSSIKIDNNGNATINRKESRTDILNYTLGVSFHF